MKVLHVISGIDPRSGGPVTALRGLTIAMQRLGIEIQIAATHRADDDLRVVEELRTHGINVALIGPTRSRLGYHPGLQPTLEQLVAACDIVHVHGLWEQIQHVAARCAADNATPYVVRPCGMLDPWSLRQSRWRKQLYFHWRLRRNLDEAAALHFTTPREHQLTQQLRLSAAAIIEPNGIDLAAYAHLPKSGAFRARYPQLGERPLVLFLGRLHPKKGLDLLLPAIANVTAHGRAAPMLVLAGPGESRYRRQLDRTIRRLQLERDVLLTGMLHGQRKLEALVDADVFVLPSYQENFGIAVIEALAAGTPAIVSDRVNLCDMVVEHNVGEVVEPSVDALSDALGRWLDDPTACRDAGQRGRALVCQRYEWQGIAERWIGHYQRLGQPKPLEAVVE